MVEEDDDEDKAFGLVQWFNDHEGSDLMSFLFGIPEPQRPALFQSLLFEAYGRTINPVNGAVGLLWNGNWSLCQVAVDMVQRAMFYGQLQSSRSNRWASVSDHMRSSIDVTMEKQQTDVGLDLCFNQNVKARKSAKRMLPSLNYEELETTTMESGFLISSFFWKPVVGFAILNFLFDGQKLHVQADGGRM